MASGSAAALAVNANDIEGELAERAWADAAHCLS
jgi:hypothetical protein